MTEPHSLPRILAAFSETPWAIRPEKLAAMVALLAVRATGERLDKADVLAGIGTAESGPPVRAVRRGVALVPVFGVLGPKMNQMLAISGGTSTEQLASDVQRLVADDSVTALVFAFDSPGGSCAGLTECATTIRSLRGTKPMVGVASHQAASAACDLLAQCDRVYASPSADVGSVGVFTVHEDLSAAQDKLGIKRTLIYSGKYKTEGNPFQPLSDEGRAAMQRRVAQTYDRLVADIAAGRGISESVVRDGYGQGRLLTASDALAAGMVDEIATLQDVIDDLAARTPSGVSRTRSGAGAPTRQAITAGDWQRRLTLDLQLLDL